ncbi:MAG: stage II sporulation protein M [Acidobacteriota bacterium]
MRNYQRFVEKRAPIWNAFEAGVARPAPEADYRDLEDLAFRYRQILHDHALAAARYPDSGAAQRLRRLALAGTRRLAGGSPPRRFSLKRFFVQTYPAAFRSHLQPLMVATAVFLGASLLGLVGAAVRPELGIAFIGEEAREGLRHGRLWTEDLGTTVPPSIASSGIATNNASVALTAWAGGATAGLISFYILLLNGLMLGAVVGITLQYSMAAELFEFIAAHGPLELTLIVVASAAGLGMARALVAADDRPRGEALKEAVGNALTVLLGSLPWFFLLGVVEGYISPEPAVPPLLKVAVGLSLWMIYVLVSWNPWLAPGLETSP